MCTQIFLSFLLSAKIVLCSLRGETSNLYSKFMLTSYRNRIPLYNYYSILFIAFAELVCKFKKINKKILFVRTSVVSAFLHRPSLRVLGSVSPTGTGRRSAPAARERTRPPPESGQWPYFSRFTQSGASGGESKLGVVPVFLCVAK